jgi:hypothetical protein
MTQLATHGQMGVKKGQPLFRVLNPTTGTPLLTRDEQPVDGGGYKKEWMARNRAEAINEYYKERS